MGTVVGVKFLCKKLYGEIQGDSEEVAQGRD